MKKQRFVVDIFLPMNDDKVKVDKILSAIDRGLGYPDWRIDVKEVKNPQ